MAGQTTSCGRGSIFKASSVLHIHADVMLATQDASTADYNSTKQTYSGYLEGDHGQDVVQTGVLSFSLRNGWWAVWSKHHLSRCLVREHSRSLLRHPHHPRGYTARAHLPAHRWLPRASHDRRSGNSHWRWSVTHRRLTVAYHWGLFVHHRPGAYGGTTNKRHQR